MKQERLQILQMLEDGKITADDAVKLLDALKVSGEGQFHRFHRNWDWDNDDENSFDFDEHVKKFTKNVESFAKEVREKADSAWKVAEPKVKAGAKFAVEKTAALAAEISRSLNESLKKFEKTEEGCCCGAEKEDEKAEGCCGDDDAPREN